jgi:hypothetical protein
MESGTRCCQRRRWTRTRAPEPYPAVAVPSVTSAKVTRAEGIDRTKVITSLRRMVTIRQSASSRWGISITVALAYVLLLNLVLAAGVTSRAFATSFDGASDVHVRCITSFDEHGDRPSGDHGSAPGTCLEHCLAVTAVKSLPEGEVGGSGVPVALSRDGGREPVVQETADKAALHDSAGCLSSWTSRAPPVVV